MDATAVTHTIVRAVGARAGPPHIIWPRAILEPPFKCRNCRKSRNGPAVDWRASRLSWGFTGGQQGNALGNRAARGP